MRLLVLYSRLSGYISACLRTFRSVSGAEIRVYAWPNQKNAPFDSGAFNDIGDVRERKEISDTNFDQILLHFKPDAVLVSGWIDGGYVQICRELKSQGIPIISGCDTQWTGSLRQRGAGLIAPWHLHKFIDILWVSGERQRQLAAKLGYTGDRCWDGFYACDWDAFAFPKNQLKDM